MELTTPPAFLDGTLADLHTHRSAARAKNEDAENAYLVAVTKAGEPIRRYVLARIRRGCGGAWWACTSSVRAQVGSAPHTPRSAAVVPTVTVTMHGTGNARLTACWSGFTDAPLDTWLDRVIVAWKAINA